MTLLRLTALLICTGCMAGQCSVIAADVIVALNDSASAVSDQTVHVQDIASVFGGTDWDRRNIGQLDLESLQEDGRCTITKKQVAMRLLLAGYKRDTFQITGPDLVAAQHTSPIQLRGELERLLESEIARQYAVGSDRVSVRLTNQAHLATLEKQLAGNKVTLELLPRNEFPIGRTRLNIDLIDANGHRHPQSLDAQVSLAMKVAIAKQPIARGTIVSEDMLQQVDRAITAKADYLNPETAIGRTTSRYIPSNSILLANHLVATRQDSSQGVRRNDLLDVVIKIGRGEIRLKDARAMEAGRIGDTIEVLNPQTNRRINASIIGPNLATVSSHVGSP
ncbi:MAG: flagellar basal body P-ring formation protein FlgA [Planctomycetales bacterium]|nr:flagellar basal body P-ring formation protein FlgA [Planctomycetales bacterium]